MVDSNLVTVTNNENPAINVEITAHKNEVNLEFNGSIDSVLSVHNVSEDAHGNRFSALKTNLETKLALKANIETTYSKTEVDTALTGKVSTTDETITKQGNVFNGASELVKLDENGKLPAVNGSLLTNIISSQITDASSNFSNINLSNLSTTGKAAVSNLAMISNVYIDLTLGASGATYTAPADGYYFLNKSAASAGETLYPYNNTAGYGRKNFATGVGHLWCDIPVKKGDVINIQYTATGTTNVFRFYYNEGSKP